MQGYVQRYDFERGYGFIRNEAGDWYFRSSDVIGEITRGAAVEFWLDDSRVPGRGLVAVEVRRIVKLNGMSGRKQKTERQIPRRKLENGVCRPVTMNNLLSAEISSYRR